MKVFHGTNAVIEQPQIINRFKTLDFGEGFYTTENENQAKEFYKSNLFDKLQNPNMRVVRFFNTHILKKNVKILALLVEKNVQK